MSKKTKVAPVPCVHCGVRPTLRSTQFRGSIWSGETGWRAFCGDGKHHASSGWRAHKADAVADWNALQALAGERLLDPAKFGTRAILKEEGNG